MTTYQNNINSLPIAVVIFDSEEHILEYSVPFNQWSINTLTLGHTLINTLSNDTYLQIREFVRLAKSGQKAECDVQLNSGDGNYYRVYISPIKENKPCNYFMLSAVPKYADNTMLATQKQTDRYLRVTMDTIDQGITIHNKNLELVAWNPVYEGMQIFPPEFIKFGFPLKQAYKGIAELGVFGPGDPEKLANKHIESIRTREMIAEEELYPPTGRVIKIHRYYLPDGGMCATFTDITVQKKNDLKLFHQANTDPLTNISNRYSILNQIQTNTQSGEEKDSFCLLFLDLDYFKLVNDTFGHHTGDILLKNVTRRILEQIDQDKGDSVGRLGGDEFAIILKSVQGIHKATIFCQKLLNSLAETYSINHHSIFISGTIGLSIFPDHGHSKEVLIRNADTAMYFAKQEGRNRFKFYDDSIGEVFVKRTRVAEALVHELVTGGEKFHLLFQPIVDIPTQRMVAVESLLRWQDQNKYNETFAQRGKFTSLTQKSFF